MSNSETSPVSSSPRFFSEYRDGEVYWKAAVERTRFEIRVAPFPKATVIILNGVFIAFFAGFFSLTYCFSSSESNRWIGCIASIVIGLMTCIGYTALMRYRFRPGLPWLVYDSVTETVTLPRLNKTFPAQAVHLRCLYLVPGSGDQACELQAAVRDNGREECHLLLASIFSWQVFEPLLLAVERNTPLQKAYIPMKDFKTPALHVV